MGRFLKKNWFILGLIILSILTIGDFGGILASTGLWLKNHRGPDIVIVLIFVLSGLALDINQVKDGLTDTKGTLIALVVIFIAAPLSAALFTLVPLDKGVLIGLLLVAVMPTTLSSGVVMTGSAGGNMAHALFITIIANSLAVLTIPLSLGLLLKLTGDSRVIEIDQIPIMLKIASFVLLPLVTGIILRRFIDSLVRPWLKLCSIINQCAILSIVWMALSAGRDAILGALGSLIIIVLLVFFFHLALLIVGFLFCRFSGIEKGKRESVILMGGQKTLPLSAILQVSLFPTLGTALVVCVVHHIVHLIMDAAVVGMLKEKE
ncbi:MAG: bile acid:sodium symporter [Desulfobulbaceae bacterium]|nr:MAG: bile acid:sodium symporter [Desulfobulbaceae bacterium]